MLTRRSSSSSLFIPALPALVALAAFVVGGCASPKVVPTTKHEPSSPSAVQIYQKAPAKDYEVHGTVTLKASEQYKWDDRGNADAAYDELKRQAAAMGANGLLMDAPADATDARVTAGYHGQFYQIPVKLPKPVTAIATAIYVHDKK
jgi:hypothetical protein